MRNQATFLLVVGVLVGSCHTQCQRIQPARKPLQRISFLLNWSFYGEHAPFFAAQELGYFAEEGLEVEILSGSGSASTVKVIGSGAHDFGYAGAETMLKAVSVGVPVLAVAVIQQMNPMAVIFKADAKISRVEDLRGKRIGVTVGDANSQLLPALLKAHNLKREDVEIIALPTAKAKEEYLFEDKIEAFVGFFHDQPPRMQARSGVKLKWLSYFTSGVNTLSSSIIVHRQRLLEDPGLAKRFLRAVTRGVQFTRDKPQEAAEIFTRAVEGISLALAEEMIELSLDLHFTERSTGHPIGWSHPLDWQDTISYLTRYTGLRSSGEPNEFFTNEFLGGNTR